MNMNVAAIIQAVRGPIMLITLGGLILIDYNTHFRFNQTWPVLIIVFGVLKLAERMAGPTPEAFPPPGPGYAAPPPPPPSPENGGQI